MFNDRGERLLEFQDGLLCVACLGQLNCAFSGSEWILGMFCFEVLQSFFQGFVLLHFGMQQRFDSKQASTVRVGFKKLVDIFQAGQPLLSLEHVLNGLQITEEIFTAEFHLFPSATGARHITIEGHGGLSGASGPQSVESGKMQV